MAGLHCSVIMFEASNRQLNFVMTLSKSIKNILQLITTFKINEVDLPGISSTLAGTNCKSLSDGSPYFLPKNNSYI